MLEEFSTDATRGVRGAVTVTTAAIQLAWHLGFREFYLIGHDVHCDTSTTLTPSRRNPPRTGFETNSANTPGDEVTYRDPPYVGKGAGWHDPKVDDMKREMIACRDAIEMWGGTISNATPDDELEVVPSIEFERLFESGAGRP